MFRLSCRLTAALLWIAIALLPVRGFAAVLMTASMALPAASQQAVAPAEAPLPDASAMPCHGMAAPADASSDASHTCSLCDLCHTTVAPASQRAAGLPVLPDAVPPAATPEPVDSRAPGGLFRPPRTQLA